MTCNPNRLTLLLDIGFLVSRAKAQENIDRLIIAGDVPPPPMAHIYWEDVFDKLEELALMDHIDDFTPDQSPMLEGTGCLKSYQTLRHWYKLGDMPDDFHVIERF
ncbi:hypothetical protein ACKUFS_03890 [Pseudomonas cannabina]|uniref:Uncharacterized protein n=1 Tax=Pseudomonas syringae pv. maculicola str. ES4326 TaxID=629265 RepID=A0A8T8BWJ0_PSEYM|nr:MULTISPECIES: hypothetical protein [Pseudomonas syringae group]QHE95740.1 hypothetical protein PMA4326_003245 [Pseudomonas syringae pv. maculicola str. ES4326]QQN23616.1 hypothetical protein JGS08_08340 [Pseudomonas cannabina pv. alisalensis]UBY96372.1 hypothetical protein LCG56_20655 [Pseudomonas cannabina pv. alisalensis]